MLRRTNSNVETISDPIIARHIPAPWLGNRRVAPTPSGDAATLTPAWARRSSSARRGGLPAWSSADPQPTPAGASPPTTLSASTAPTRHSSRSSSSLELAAAPASSSAMRRGQRPPPPPLPPLTLRHRRAATHNDEQLGALRDNPLAHARSASASVSASPEPDTRPVFSRTQQRPTAIFPVHSRSASSATAAMSDLTPSSVESSSSAGSPSAPTPGQQQQQQVPPSPRSGPLAKLTQPVRRAFDSSSPIWPYTYIHDDDNIWTGFVPPMFCSDDVRTALKVPEANDRPQYCVAVLRSYVSRKLGRTNANITSPKVTAKLSSLETELIETENRIHLARAFAQVRNEYAFGDSPVAPVRVRQLPHWRMRSISRSSSQPITDSDYVDDDDYILSVAPAYTQASDAGMEAQLAKYRKLKKFVKSAHFHVQAANERGRVLEAKAAAAEKENARLGRRIAQLEAAALGQQAFPLARRESADSACSGSFATAPSIAVPASTPAEATPAALSIPTVPPPVTIVPIAPEQLGPEEVITTPLSSPVLTPSEYDDYGRSLHGTPMTDTGSLPSVASTSPRTPAMGPSELAGTPPTPAMGPSELASTPPTLVHPLPRPLPRPPRSASSAQADAGGNLTTVPESRPVSPPPRPARRKSNLPDDMELPSIPRLSVFSLSTMLTAAEEEH